MHFEGKFDHRSQIFYFQIAAQAVFIFILTVHDCYDMVAATKGVPMKRMFPRLLVFLLLALALMSVVVHMQDVRSGDGNEIVGMIVQVVALVLFAGMVWWMEAHPSPHDHDSD